MMQGNEKKGKQKMEEGKEYAKNMEKKKTDKGKHFKEGERNWER